MGHKAFFDPFMGRIGKGKQMIGVTVSDSDAQIIDERREGLRWSRAAFMLAIFEDWRARGCPPVCEPDRLMQLAKATEAKPAKKKTA